MCVCTLDALMCTMCRLSNPFDKFKLENLCNVIHISKVGVCLFCASEINSQVTFFKVILFRLPRSFMKRVSGWILSLSVLRGVSWAGCAAREHILTTCDGRCSVSRSAATVSTVSKWSECCRWWLEKRASPGAAPHLHTQNFHCWLVPPLSCREPFRTLNTAWRLRQGADTQRWRFCLFPLRNLRVQT